MQSKSITTTAYELAIRDGVFVCRWKPDFFATSRASKGLYIYGRDYAELLQSAASGVINSRQEIINPRSAEFRRVVAAYSTIDDVYKGFRFDQRVEDILSYGSVFTFSNGSPESFLTKLQEREPKISPLIPIVRANIEVGRSILVRHDERITITSVDALEGTPFLLSLLNIVNSDNSGRWVIFGPSRYMKIFNMDYKERPFIPLVHILQLYEQATSTSQANAAEKCASWEAARFGNRGADGVTVAEANDFLRYAESPEPAMELATQLVPPPVAAPPRAPLAPSTTPKTIPD